MGLDNNEFFKDQDQIEMLDEMCEEEYSHLDEVIEDMFKEFIAGETELQKRNEGEGKK